MHSIARKKTVTMFCDECEYFRFPNVITKPTPKPLPAAEVQSVSTMSNFFMFTYVGQLYDKFTCMGYTCNKRSKSASRGAHSPVRGHPRGSKVVPLNSSGKVSY